MFGKPAEGETKYFLQNFAKSLPGPQKYLEDQDFWNTMCPRYQLLSTPNSVVQDFK